MLLHPQASHLPVTPLFCAVCCLSFVYLLHLKWFNKKLWCHCMWHPVLGPLQSVMQDLHSEDNDDDSEDDDDNDGDSDAERPAHTHLTHHQRRLVTADQGVGGPLQSKFNSGIQIIYSVLCQPLFHITCVLRFVVLLHFTWDSLHWSPDTLI